MQNEVQVLIVDDDQIFCQLLAEMLGGKGYKVQCTTDCLAGYEMALCRPYDVFIVDVRMPLLLGTEFAEGLKKERPAAKIILISAFADDALVERAQRLGVSLLSKPFSTDRLLELIAKTLGR